jgi:hypothetical protein
MGIQAKLGNMQRIRAQARFYLPPSLVDWKELQASTEYEL